MNTNMILQPGEEIKSIIDFEGLYSITSLGRLYTHEKIKKVRNGWGKYKAKFLKLSLNKKTGYLYVILYKINKRKIYLIHRLEAQAFIPNPDDLPEVNHKDGIKSNNYVGTAAENYKDGNLEWCSHQKNMSHALVNGLYNKETSRYYGVSFDKSEKVKSKPWRTRITINKKTISLGNFKTEIEAARAYNTYVLEHKLNRPLNKI